jgi:transcriptional regulator with XRE-family HTH domain
MDEREWTIAELAEAAGVSTRAITNMRAGKLPSLRILEKVLDQLAMNLMIFEQGIDK